MMANTTDNDLVKIVGIEEGGRGQNCEHHIICGQVLQLDSVVRIRTIQILNDHGMEETAIGCYWITDGIDGCLVGFLRRHCIVHADIYNNKLAQIVELHWNSNNKKVRQRSHAMRGLCMATIID